MRFSRGQSVTRLRRKEVFDKYSGAVMLGDWLDAEALVIPRAFVASSSTSKTQEATRTEVLEAKSLYCSPRFDIGPYDRIQVGQAVYEVEGVPEADANPWSGWQPVQEIPLRRVI